MVLLPSRAFLEEIIKQQKTYMGRLKYQFSIINPLYLFPG